METLFSHDLNFQLGNSGFWTAKREGGSYIRDTPPDNEVMVQIIGSEVEPLTETFEAGQNGAVRFQRWCRANQDLCSNGTFSRIGLRRVTKTDA